MSYVDQIQFNPAFDDLVNNCTHTPQGNHGRGTVTFKMWSVKERCAAVWTIHTDWHLPETYERGLNIYDRPMDWTLTADKRVRPPTGVIDLHSPVPLFPDHTSRGSCPYTEGTCYLDAAFMASDDLWDALIRRGDTGVWPLLHEWVDDLVTRGVTV